jgi:hypothetical protein
MSSVEARRHALSRAGEAPPPEPTASDDQLKRFTGERGR